MAVILVIACFKLVRALKRESRVEGAHPPWGEDRAPPGWLTGERRLRPPGEKGGWIPQPAVFAQGAPKMAYRLYYWPTIQGRGEFVRLALEAAGAAYQDVGRGPDGPDFAAVSGVLWGEEPGPPAFAPPVLDVGGRLIAQTANILLYLGDHFRLAPAGELGRLWVHQVQLTLADFVLEIHDTHHPVGVTLYYEDQKAEAARRAAVFREHRLPKFLGYFERVLADNPDGGWLAGDDWTYADLSLFQVVDGLRYAFPEAMAQAEYDTPRVTLVHEWVSGIPNIAAYLASERRIPFNEDGIFRHYPELDG